jgi:hypothetical protein
MEDYFQRIKIFLFIMIKNSLLVVKHFLLVMETERTWRQRIQTDEKYLLIHFLNVFRWLHPDIGVRLAQYLSVKNKLISGDEDVTFLGKTTNG